MFDRISQKLSHSLQLNTFLEKYTSFKVAFEPEKDEPFGVAKEYMRSVNSIMGDQIPLILNAKNEILEIIYGSGMISLVIIVS